MVQKIKCIQRSSGRPEGKRLLDRPRCICYENIKTDNKETRWEHVDRNDGVSGREKWRAVVNTVMNIRFN
jgi:hypothetical protein